MNWRIDLDYFLVKELVFKGKLRDLLAEDQLLKNIKYDNVLDKFSEG